MKRIGTPTVIALSIATLGIYSFIWLACRRNEITDQYKIKLPSNGWIIASAILVYLGSFSAMAVILSFMLGLIPSVWVTITIAIAPFILAYVLGLWFITHFGAAIARITGGRIPLWWTILLYLPLYTFVLFVYQFFINRLSVAPPKLAKHTGPTIQFTALSVVAAALLYTLTFASYKDLPRDLETAKSQTPQMSQIIKDASALSQKADQLQKEYDSCLAALERKYPGELTSENEAAYQTSYEACEEIRIEQNNTVEQYKNIGR